MAQKYFRYEVLTLAEFLIDIKTHCNDKKEKVQRPSGKWVGCTSLRLRTFYRASKKPGGIVCVGCGIVATHFAVESSPGTSSAHVNLYGMKGDAEVLFTHDHILARGLGGADNLSNTQVMCAPCNNKKSVGETKEFNRRKKLAEELSNVKIDD